MVSAAAESARLVRSRLAPGWAATSVRCDHAHDQNLPDVARRRRPSLRPAAARAAEDVDLLLVLAADVSRSIDATKFQLQREGYAAAVADPRVLDAIRTGRTGRIGLTFVEWSGVGAQKVVIDWTTIGDADSAKGFGDRLLEAPRSFADRTSISRRDRIRHGAARQGAL